MEPAKLIAETFENGCHNEFTTFGFRFSQWEEKARQVLSANSYGYVKGSAGDGYTDNQECQDFKKWQFVPRRLVPVAQCDVVPKYKVLGQNVPSPIAVAPIGVNTIFHREGECLSLIHI